MKNQLIPFTVKMACLVGLQMIIELKIKSIQRPEYDRNKLFKKKEYTLKRKIRPHNRNFLKYCLNLKNMKILTFMPSRKCDFYYILKVINENNKSHISKTVFLKRSYPSSMHF